MTQLDVFVSVGGTANDQQEAFVRAIEDRLRSEGLVPHTAGRNTFSSDAPLRTVIDLLDKCSGTVVIALERFFFESGVEKRGGPKQNILGNVRLPTPWNQIEAAMAYTRGHPIMIIVESGLTSGGLLERGNDWHIQWVDPNVAALNTVEFKGVLASWKDKMIHSSKRLVRSKDPSDLTVAELIGGLKATQLWSMLGALAASWAAPSLWARSCLVAKTTFVSLGG
jgi:hypothetical protein